jgi:uncharacterized protein YkwD
MPNAVFARVRPVALVAVAVLASLALCAPAFAARPHHHRTHHHRGHHRLHHRRERRALRHGCANADKTVGSVPVGALRGSVVCLINVQRRAHRLPALLGNTKLDRSSQLWTGVMVTTSQFTHGLDFSARITAAGFIWSWAGENIATGFPTPRSVVTAWMASPDHCRNILDPHYSMVGTGVVGRPVVGFASGPATWTQDFGLPMGASAPSGNTGPQSGCPYKI